MSSMAATVRRIAELPGVEPPDEDADRIALSHPDWGFDGLGLWHGKAEVFATGTRVSLDIKAIPADVALRMLAILTGAQEPGNARVPVQAIRSLVAVITGEDGARDEYNPNPLFGDGGQLQGEFQAIREWLGQTGEDSQR